LKTLLYTANKKNHLGYERKLKFQSFRSKKTGDATPTINLEP